MRIIQITTTWGRKDAPSADNHWRGVNAETTLVAIVEPGEDADVVKAALWAQCRADVLAQRGMLDEAPTPATVTPATPLTFPATERQIAYLRDLAAERGLDLAAELNGRDLTDLTRDEAGTYIVDWKQRPRPTRPQPSAPDDLPFERGRDDDVA